MDIDLWLSIIGAGISLIGAAVSIRYYKNAKKIRDDIALEQKKQSFNHLHIETNRILESSRKLTTAPSVTSQAEIDLNKITEDIRKYLDLIKGNQHHFSFNKRSECQKHCYYIENRLNKFCAEHDPSKLIDFGISIHNSIGELLKLISPELDINKNLPGN